jgi:hypothetical protein
VTLGTDRGAKRLPRAVFVRILSATPGCGSPLTRYQSTGARYQFTGAPADEPPPKKETPLSKISGTRVRRRREGLGRGGTARARARRDAFARSRPPEPIAAISSRPTGTVRDRSRRVEGRRASRVDARRAAPRPVARRRDIAPESSDAMVHRWCSFRRFSEISADATEPKSCHCDSYAIRFRNIWKEKMHGANTLENVRDSPWHPSSWRSARGKKRSDLDFLAQANSQKSPVRAGKRGAFCR